MGFPHLTHLYPPLLWLFQLCIFGVYVQNEFITIYLLIYSLKDFCCEISVVQFPSPPTQSTQPWPICHGLTVRICIKNKAPPINFILHYEVCNKVRPCGGQKKTNLTSGVLRDLSQRVTQSTILQL